MLQSLAPSIHPQNPNPNSPSSDPAVRPIDILARILRYRNPLENSKAPGLMSSDPYGDDRTANSSSISDNDLVTALVGTSSFKDRAWVELITRYGPRIKNAIRRTLDALQQHWSEDDVEDIAADTWLRIFKTATLIVKSWNPARGTLGNYIGRIGSWEAGTWCRRKRRRSSLDIAVRISLPTITQPAFDHAHESARWSIVIQPDSSSADSEVIRLRASGKSIRDIARRLGVSRMRVFRTIRKLKLSMPT